MDERLEEIQELEGYGGLGGYAVYFENKKQFEWLKKQAEKVPKLERKLSINTNNMKQLQQENQRYKERLQQTEESNIQMFEQQQKLRKDIKDWYELAYQLKDEKQRYGKVLEFYASRTAWIDGDIYVDGGEKARQELEGE
ncbi:hypothetical protein [Oceanobacillus oncorhynchi]|uniref:hypothetical protein n=1 Tax=Oceanobacillus oncorhynchi TaxID=545501 RepID=UPI0018678313|nr:hypothetical protein [Oceanobacillus oncorhynchi]